jgi:hypothetical protein
MTPDNKRLTAESFQDALFETFKAAGYEPKKYVRKERRPITRLKERPPLWIIEELGLILEISHDRYHTPLPVVRVSRKDTDIAMVCTPIQSLEEADNMVKVCILEHVADKQREYEAALRQGVDAITKLKQRGGATDERKTIPGA